MENKLQRFNVRVCQGHINRYFYFNQFVLHSDLNCVFGSMGTDVKNNIDLIQRSFNDYQKT